MYDRPTRSISELWHKTFYKCTYKPWNTYTKFKSTSFNLFQVESLLVFLHNVFCQQSPQFLIAEWVWSVPSSMCIQHPVDMPRPQVHHAWENPLRMSYWVEQRVWIEVWEGGNKEDRQRKDAREVCQGISLLGRWGMRWGSRSCGLVFLHSRHSLTRHDDSTSSDLTLIISAPTPASFSMLLLRKPYFANSNLDLIDSKFSATCAAVLEWCWGIALPVHPGSCSFGWLVPPSGSRQEHRHDTCLDHRLAWCWAQNTLESATLKEALDWLIDWLIDTPRRECRCIH